jgi:hypothetical protein
MGFRTNNKYNYNSNNNKKSKANPKDKIEDIVQNEVNKFDTTLRTKSLSIQKRDKFIMYFEILTWVLYVIQSIKEKGLHWKFNI